MSKSFLESRHKENEPPKAASSQKETAAKSNVQFKDNRPEAVAQRKLQEKANNSLLVTQQKVKQQKINNSSAKPVQRNENKTGMPDHLKSGIENLSGHSLDNVKVHYNSSKPAQLNADAFAQGSDIHLASGQEKHLPHEAWHVVQQQQGRVKPTTQLSGTAINDNPALEKEATVMGGKANQQHTNEDHQELVQRMVSKGSSTSSGVVQMAGHPEDLCILQSGEWVIKRIDEFEKEEYERLRGVDRASRQQDRAQGVVIPHFRGPFNTYGELERSGIRISAKDKQKMETKQPNAPESMLPLPDGKYLVAMENVTGGDKDSTPPRDLKMGRHSASGTDQAHHNVGWFKRKKKAIQHDWMDEHSPSKKLGFRDEDQWKKTKKKGLVGKGAEANIETNLMSFRKEIDGSSKPARAEVIKSLVKIYQWVQHSPTVYVGASILVTFNNERPEKSTARLIDFEHPLTATKGEYYSPKFEEYKQDMLDGIRSIIEVIDTFEEYRSQKAYEERTEKTEKIMSDKEHPGVINSSDEGNVTIGEWDL